MSGGGNKIPLRVSIFKNSLNVQCSCNSQFRMFVTQYTIYSIQNTINNSKKLLFIKSISEEFFFKFAKRLNFYEGRIFCEKRHLTLKMLSQNMLHSLKIQFFKKNSKKYCWVLLLKNENGSFTLSIIENGSLLLWSILVF